VDDQLSNFDEAVWSELYGIRNLAEEEVTAARKSDDL